MPQSKKAVVLHETHYPRQLLYTRALENNGIAVAPSRAVHEMKELLSNSHYLLVIISVPDESGLRQRFLEGLRGLVTTAPLIVLDSEPFHSEDFDLLPVRAHFWRSAVNLPEVISHIVDILHER